MINTKSHFKSIDDYYAKAFGNYETVKNKPVNELITFENCNDDIELILITDIDYKILREKKSGNIEKFKKFKSRNFVRKLSPGLFHFNIIDLNKAYEEYFTVDNDIPKIKIF